MPLGYELRLHFTEGTGACIRKHVYLATLFVPCVAVFLSPVPISCTNLRQLLHHGLLVVCADRFWCIRCPSDVSKATQL